MKDLKKKNFYYQTNKGKSYKVGLYKAAEAYTKWCMEGTLDEKEIAEIKTIYLMVIGMQKFPGMINFLRTKKKYYI